MIAPEIPADETARLAALEELGILDSPAELKYDAVVRNAADALDMPIAYVSFIDSERQWLKSNLGMPAAETNREETFCGHAILQDKPLVVSDTHQDSRFADNPMVVGEPHLRFYAGVPLRSPAGFNVGTLCVGDTKPRRLTEQQLDALQGFATQIERELTVTILKTLVVTKPVGRTQLVETLGDGSAADIFGRQNRLARDLVAAHRGVEIDKTDGFLLLFRVPLGAVDFALAYHRGLAELSASVEVELATRVAIHLGEVVVTHNTPEEVQRGAKPVEVEGFAKPLTSRLGSLAAPRQTLMTTAAFDMARAALSESDTEARAELRWLAHGDYLLEGSSEPLEVFEVGVEGLAPLRPPQDHAQAQRLGEAGAASSWRPAPGQEIPQRERWIVQEKLGEGGFGEVWLARHVKSGERRVFKFCHDPERLRTLRREVTIFRLLKEVLGDRRDINRILDWHFEDAPYFLESEYTESGSLLDWARDQGGLPSVPIETRLEIVAQTAEALAAAHSVGVLHKDIKPANLLIRRDEHGRPRVRVTDFGISELLDEGVLADAEITASGLTAEVGEAEGGSTLGTRMYIAPEVLQGEPASVQADIYALGVLLYQMVVGDLCRVLAPGWEREVEDKPLREDIARAVDGSPSRRYGNALRIAERVRDLEPRRRRNEQARQASRRQERNRRWTRVAWIGAAAAGLLLAVVAVFAQRLDQAERELEAERDRAQQAETEALAADNLLQQVLSGVASLDHGQSLMSQGRHAEAEAAMLSGYAQLGTALGPQHETTRAAATRLAELYAVTGRADEATRYRVLAQGPS